MSTAQRSSCPPASILDAIALGHVAEPVLNLYLEHLATCDTCCDRIERTSTTTHVTPDLKGESAPTLTADSREFASASNGIDRWLDGLKQSTRPHGDGDNDGHVTTIAHFRITGVLGTGASSVVYEALDEHLGRAVVLKALRDRLGDDEEQRRLVVSEARALAALQHEAIMPLLQVIWDDSGPVLVFPRLAGRTLADALASRTCTSQTALVAVRDVARALAHAHRLGIFHHDVKPSNIWLTKGNADAEERALLFDFGLTGATDVVGTPGYSDPGLLPMADPRSRDAFSLGVVLHECLASSKTAPPECCDLVRRLTAAEPATRPTPAHVAMEIGRLLQPRRARWRTASAIATLAVCVACVVAVSGFAFIRAPFFSTPDTKTTRSRPLQPEVIIPGGGFPAALSADARLHCFVVDGPAVVIRDVANGTDPVTVPVPFEPETVAFNATATHIALATEAGNVAIIEIPTAAISFNDVFDDGVRWMGWSGWKRDVLAVLSGTTVLGLFKTQPPRPDTPSIPDWILEERRSDVRCIATVPDADAVVSLGLDGTTTMWSMGGWTEDVPLQPPLLRVKDSAGEPLIGWKSSGVSFFANGRMVHERAVSHVLRHYDTPVPLQSIVWTSERDYVALSNESPTCRVVWGNSSTEDWSRDLDLGGEIARSITQLADHRRVAVITNKGDARIYVVAP